MAVVVANLEKLFLKFSTNNLTDTFKRVHLNSYVLRG